MRNLTSGGLAALALSVAFAACSVSAQPESDPSQDGRLRQADQMAEHSHTVVRTQPEAMPNIGPAVVPVDILRHPITPKVRQLLLRAMEKMESGDHESAIGQLLEILTKYPDSAAYVHNLLGVEYMKTDRFQAAVSSFEQAVVLLPHIAMTHYNFGLALIYAGDYDRATQEVQRGLELEPKNTKMQMRLAALLEHKR